MSFQFVVEIMYEHDEGPSQRYLGQLLADDEYSFVVNDIAHICYRSRGDSLVLTFWEHDQEQWFGMWTEQKLVRPFLGVLTSVDWDGLDLYFDKTVALDRVVVKEK